VRADPEQNYIVSILHGQSPHVQIDSRGPEIADFLEVQRGMRKIRLEQGELMACSCTSFGSAW